MENDLGLYTSLEEKNEQEVKEIDKITKEDKKDLYEIINLRSGAGKRFLSRLINKSGVFHNGQQLNKSFDTNVEFTLKGSREMGLWIFNEISEINPQYLIDMMRNDKKLFDK